MATVPGVADDDTEGALRPIEGGASGAPVFGRRTTPFDQRKYRRFGVEVETDTDRWEEFFEAYFDADAGAILNLMNARTEWQQANATAVLLSTSLRDDDGLSIDWSFPAEPVYDDDDDEPVLYDSDGAVIERDADGQPTREGGHPVYEWHDGELLSEAELRDAIAAFDPLGDDDLGSSRRRFAYIADSPRHRIQLSALNDLADWIIGDAAKRPPRRPTSSARGQSRTSRTSGARRR
jgi:hypothetical protein